MFKFNLGIKEANLTLSRPNREVLESTFISKKVWIFLIILLSLISLISWFIFYNLNLTLAYNDARSHLNVARRVIDNLQPGAAQIGSVWLPLYHILELPLIGNDFLWHSGLAGSIISMVSYVLGGVYLVGIGRKLKFALPAIIVMLGVYALNPNLIFMQTTPMTESLLVFLTLAAGYHFLSWVEKFKVLALVETAFFTFLATLTRYDGWFLLVFIGISVFWVSLKKRNLKFAEGNFFMFSTLAGFGVFLWFLWNGLIFSDPFYFVTGPFSAKAQQDILEAEGRLLTKGNIYYSFFVYLFTVRYNLGWWLTTISIAGSWLFLTSKVYSRSIKVAFGVLLSPFIFNFLSLLIGHSVIHIPELPPYTWFNDRYGLMMIPAAAVAVGYLANSKKLALVLVSLILILQTSTIFLSNNIITIEDGVRGASGQFLDDAGNWIKENVKDEKLILVAASSNDSLLFRSGLPLKRFIVEGDQKYWTQALAFPNRYAGWVVMHRGDLVDLNVRSNKLFLDNYRLVYHDSFTFIYQLDERIKNPLSQKELP